MQPLSFFFYLEFYSIQFIHIRKTKDIFIKWMIDKTNSKSKFRISNVSQAFREVLNGIDLFWEMFGENQDG